MLTIPEPAWPKTPADAVALQKEMRPRVALKNGFGKIKTIAGVDVSYDIKADTSRAVIALLDYENLSLLQSVVVDAPTSFPYVPGLLSFREIPVVLKALRKLEKLPDVLMVDGQGIAHPRRLGIAAHLGVLLDWPTLGVAKSRLTGSYKEPGAEAGSMADLTDKGERLGTVLRSKAKTNVLFISPGHKVDFDSALEITQHCLRGYRLPEPTRIADKISKQREERQGRLI
jgi:deoxyribonuclease V